MCTALSKAIIEIYNVVIIAFVDEGKFFGLFKVFFLQKCVTAGWIIQKKYKVMITLLAFCVYSLFCFIPQQRNFVNLIFHFGYVRDQNNDLSKLENT